MSPSDETPSRRPPRWRRVWPAPILSALLFLIWPVLNGSFSAGQLLLGALLATAIPWFTEAVRGERAHPRAPRAALRLTFVVLHDIVMSNIDVARRILGREEAIRPGWCWVPLRIQDPHGIVLLSGIITMTPGTLTAAVSPDRRHLLVHAFHLEDEAALIESIRTRYEDPLMEIFP